MTEMDNHGETHTRIQKKRFGEQTTSELDALLAEGKGVRQMIDLLEGFDDTPEYRARILAWRRTVWTGKGEGTPFPANRVARDVFDLMWNIEGNTLFEEPILLATSRAHKQTYW